MDRFQWQTEGKVLSCNVVKGEKYRFSILTSRLIRMEYSECGAFEDKATQTVFYRNFPDNDYSTNLNNGILTIETEYLIVNYHENKEFNQKTLKISFKRFQREDWHYGDAVSNLKGTVSTLDTVNGETELEDGICSRKGCALIDDSNSVLLSNDGWFEIRKNHSKDLYFFGYGHDYLDCIADYYRLTGIPPLLPNYALGNWWSRYHKYTQEEYTNLILRFERENIPFSVSVIDMDWHTIEIPKESYIDHPKFRKGWTGYSWNKELFPDYKAFLRFLKEHNLKTALNLHPSNGVGCHEDMYTQMAEACNIEPDSKKLIKFDLLNPKFMEKYFDILHHPYEEDGVDFWWMDWQQGNDYWWVHDEEHLNSELEQIDPLWLLNHLHILDISRNGKRPMFFSRYSGLGSHRYHVGFSGDTVITWESLKFQPYFTATSSNVGYSWWSHDIGGHMDGYRDDELQIRWLQLGVFSPINRLHSSNNLFAGKEPWNLKPECEKIACDYLRLRHRLFPYIYTMNYRNHQQLKPMIQPMYYTHPENDEAYTVPNQYWFGSELIVSPITEKNDDKSLLGKTTVWLPKGLWIDAFNGFIYKGDCKIEVHRKLDEIPIFAKAGAIIPLESYENNNIMGNKENMLLNVFTGGNNTFTLYEDNGDGSGYKHGECVTTDFTLEWMGDKARFVMHPSKGDLSCIPQKRNWKISFNGIKNIIDITVKANDAELNFEKEYDAQRNRLFLSINEVSVDEEVVIQLSADTQLISSNENANERIFDILIHAQMSYALKSRLWTAVKSGNNNLYTVCPEEQYKGVLDAIQELMEL